ncbi:MAG: methyltransferase [Myxococcota bacterium]|nr:methyltransferase [Myxococcota bacterium]
MPQRDLILNGQLGIWQPEKKDGYRFNIDSLLLAGYALRTLSSASHVVELGSGSAVIGLVMLHNHSQMTYEGVELQASLADLSQLSIQEASFEARAVIRQGDLRASTLPAGGADVVVFNPPYFREGSGRSSSNLGRRMAREALHGDIDAFLVEAKRLLAPGGRVFAVLRPERRKQALANAAANGLHPREVCSVYTCEGGKHQLDLLQLTAESFSSEEPTRLALYLHQAAGQRAYNEAVDSFLMGKTPSLPAEAFSSEPEQN